MQMSTALLSRDQLDPLGFSFAKYLVDKYDSVKDSEISSKVEACAYTGVTYAAQNDNPIEPHMYLSEKWVTRWRGSHVR